MCAVAGRSSADVTVNISFLGSGFSRNWSLNSRPFREPAVSSLTVSARLRHCATTEFFPHNTCDSTFYPRLPDSERALLFRGSQAASVCPSAKSNMYMKMSVEQWWNDTDSGNRSTGKILCPGNTLSATIRTYTDLATKPDMCGERPAIVS